MNKVTPSGVLRTAHKLFLTLRYIFDMIADDYGISSPMMKHVLPYIDFEKAKGVNVNTLHSAMKRFSPKPRS